MRWFYLVVGIQLLASCGQGSNADQFVGSYFNLDSLISIQVSLLAESPIAVNKKVAIRGEVEAHRFTLDSAGWAKELALFRESDINRPIYSGMYKTKRGLQDEHSNLLYDSYEALEGISKIRAVRVFYFKDLTNLKKVEIEQLEENVLYFSKRDLSMSFHNWENIVLLSGYQIAVVQKLPMRDSIFLRVSGQIIPEN